MPNQSIQSFVTINPLVGLPARTLRLYSALEVFKEAYPSCDKPEWFRAPKRDALMKKIGFSKTEIETGIRELIQANLLQIQEWQNTRWYCLK